MSETKRREVDYKNIQEPMLAHIKTKLQEYVDIKEYSLLALNERKKWEKDSQGYDPETAPERVRDLCKISLKNVKSGVSSTLCRSVESLPVEVAGKICRLANTPGTVKMIPYAESLLKKYDIGQKQDKDQSPNP
jgi:hypothetical protein